MGKKFRLNLLRKKRHDPPLALPPSTTGRQPPAAKAPAPKQPTKAASSGRFGRKKDPSGLEVTATAASSSGPHDEVSVITPVTGLPPDSPDRIRNLPSLLPPPQPSHPQAGLYGGAWSPPSSPSRGDMKIDVGRSRSEDEISVMTPVTGVPVTPDKAPRKAAQRLVPPRILDDDDESRELTVYEEDGGSVNDSANIVGGKGDVQLTSSTPWKIETVLAPGKPKAPTKTKERKRLNAFASRLLQSKRSWLTNTAYFQKAIDASFSMVDADKSGDVTLEELYAGVLLIHLKMAVYVGAPACRPAGKGYVTEIFHLLDADDSGTLSKEEFAMVVKILYSQVFTRIVIHWMLTLMIVPLVTQYIIKYTSLFFWISHEFWKDHDDDLDPLQRLLWRLWSVFLYLTPQFVDRMGGFVCHVVGKVPTGVWKSMPFTILTLAQTSIALPYALNRVEQFFRRAAHKDVGRSRERKEK